MTACLSAVIGLSGAIAVTASGVLADQLYNRTAGLRDRRAPFVGLTRSLHAGGGVRPTRRTRTAGVIWLLAMGCGEIVIATAFGGFGGFLIGVTVLITAAMATEELVRRFHNRRIDRRELRR